jgi:hypothetical protein
MRGVPDSIGDPAENEGNRLVDAVMVDDDELAQVRRILQCICQGGDL